MKQHLPWLPHKHDQWFTYNTLGNSYNQKRTQKDRKKQATTTQVREEDIYVFNS